MAKKFYRSRKNRVIAGICSGLAEYFDIDPIIASLITLILGCQLGQGRAIGSMPAEKWPRRSRYNPIQKLHYQRVKRFYTMQVKRILDRRAVYEDL